MKFVSIFRSQKNCRKMRFVVQIKYAGGIEKQERNKSGRIKRKQWRKREEGKEDKQIKRK